MSKRKIKLRILLKVYGLISGNLSNKNNHTLPIGGLDINKLDIYSEDINFTE